MLTIFQTSGINHYNQAVWACRSCEQPIGSKPYAVYKTAYGNYRVCIDCIKSYCDNNDADLEDVTEINISGMHTCAICGAVYDTTNMEETTDGNYICDDCIADGSVFDRYEYCGRCGDLTPADDMQTVNVMTRRGQGTEEWCEYCSNNDARVCDDCGELWSEDYIDSYDVTDSDGDTDTRYICSSCYEDNYYSCASCSNLVRGEYARVDEWGDAYCPACCKHNKLKCYGKTSADRFFDLGRSDKLAQDMGLYLGIELETEDTRDCDPEDLAEELCNAIGEDRIECKEDGSLDYGCEIVTQPMSPAYHLGSKSIWPRVVEVCHDHGATSHDNGDCGMHIHISRSALSGDGYCSPSYILDRIIRLHRAEWVKFARRSCGMGWCAIDAVDPDPNASLGDKYRSWLWADHSERYRAVNFCPSETVEVRLMRGSLNLETIRASIEMVTGLVLVCQEYAEIGIDPDSKTWGETVRDVIHELETHGLPTDDLNSYLTRRGLAQETATA